MAQKDYVGRGQKKPAANKKQQASRNKQTTEDSIPWVRIILALVVIAGFGYGLWFLNQNAKQQGTEDATETQSAQPETLQKHEVEQSESDDTPLPKLEEEQWEFIEALPNYSVEVDTTEQQGSGRPYLMQCGSFRKQTQAETLKAQIAFQGMLAQVLESNGSNGLWHRVVLGPFERKRDAEKARHQLRRANINNCKIWFWD